MTKGIAVEWAGESWLKAVVCEEWFLYVYYVYWASYDGVVYEVYDMMYKVGIIINILN